MNLHFRKHGIQVLKVCAIHKINVWKARILGPGRECPCCGWTGPEFKPFINLECCYTRPRAECPHCHSLERHRLFFPIYRKFLDEMPSKPRILHMAPEACYERIFREKTPFYLLSSYPDRHPKGDCVDIRKISYPDSSFDLLIAGSVLAYAEGPLENCVREIYRVLSSSGIALISEGVFPGKTEVLPTRDMVQQYRHFGFADLETLWDPFKNIQILDGSEATPLGKWELYGIPPSPWRMMVLKKGLPVGQKYDIVV